MNIKKNRLQNAFSKRAKVYLFLFFANLLVIFGVVILTNQENRRAYNQFNYQLEVLAKVSAPYLIQNFDLYNPTSYKFQEIVSDYIRDNKQLIGFKIIDIDGKILFDSQNSTTGTNLGNVTQYVIELSRKENETLIKTGNKIEQIIEPYFSEWGSHKYSIIYIPNYNITDANITLFNGEVILIGVLISFFIFSSVGVFVISEENKIQMEEKEKLKQINRLRTNFMMLVAHNLRTPLTNIIGFGSLLKEKNLKKDQIELVDPILKNSQKLENIVENILTVTDIIGSSPESLKREDILLNDLIKETFKKLNDEVSRKNITIKLDPACEKLKIWANIKYANLVLFSIIDNAIKYNKEKGIVEISGLVDGKGKINVNISDTGTGIKNKEHIFDAFQKTDTENILTENYEGTGIGLYMTKLLLDAMDGEISFVTSPKEGTTFTLKFPPANSSE